MAIQYTTNYHLAYSDDQTALVDLATVTQQVAASLDAAMGRAGYTPPDATTFAALTARVTAVEGRVTAVEGDVATLKNRPVAALSGVNTSAPQPVHGSWQNIPLTVTDLDTRGDQAFMGGFICKQAGIYQAQGMVGFASNTVGRRGCRIVLTPSAGGTVTNATWQQFHSAYSGTFMGGSPLVYMRLAVGDRVSVEGTHEAGTGVTLATRPDLSSLLIEWKRA